MAYAGDIHKKPCADAVKQHLDSLDPKEQHCSIVTNFAAKPFSWLPLTIETLGICGSINTASAYCLCSRINNSSALSQFHKNLIQMVSPHALWKNNCALMCKQCFL